MKMKKLVLDDPKRRVVFPTWNLNTARKVENLVACDEQYFQKDLLYYI